MPDTELKDFATNILEAYARRIALNEVDALLYMTVGSQRLKLIGDLTRRMHEALKLRQPPRARSGGAYFEGVLGDFGCGKSHIGYLLQHNALRAGDELVVAHCQITGEMRFPLILSTILRSLRISGVDSLVANEIELSAYRKLAEWAGGNQQELEELIRAQLLNLPAAAASDLARAVKSVAPPRPDTSPLTKWLTSPIISFRRVSRELRPHTQETARGDAGMSEQSSTGISGRTRHVLHSAEYSQRRVWSRSVRLSVTRYERARPDVTQLSRRRWFGTAAERVTR